MGRKSWLALFSATVIAGGSVAAAAQEIENEATPDEIARVMATIAEIGCELGESVVEKENDDLFEIDDAKCTLGQFDIKLDASFNILSITNDGPIDYNAPEVEATEDEVARVTEAIAALNCEIGESEVEKETPSLFEIDDAQCEAGQYDIKLDGDFNVISLTRD